MGNNAKLNTGFHSTGYYSTGNRSTGSGSTGNCSTGNRSAGDCSTGNSSTGHHSTGDNSTGNWSISNYSSGHFSTIDYSGFSVFNKECSFEDWQNWKKPSWLYFGLTEWIPENDMTNEEKENNPTYITTGGYLKVYDYKEAFQRSYNNATREEQLKIKTCPNFDAEIFYEISGIRVDEEPEQVESLITIEIEGLKKRLEELEEKIAKGNITRIS